MSGVVLLSEIHPLGTQLFNLLVQASHWHHLIQQLDVAGRQSIDFVEALRIIWFIHTLAVASLAEMSEKY